MSRVSARKELKVSTFTTSRSFRGPERLHNSHLQLKARDHAEGSSANPEQLLRIRRSRIVRLALIEEACNSDSQE